MKSLLKHVLVQSHIKISSGRQNYLEKFPWTIMDKLTTEREHFLWSDSGLYFRMCEVFTSLFNVRDIEMLLTRALLHTVPIQWKAKCLNCSQLGASSLQINKYKWNHYLSSSTGDTPGNTVNLARFFSASFSILYYPLVIFFFQNNFTSKTNTIFTRWIHFFLKCFLLYTCLGHYRDHTYKCTVLQSLMGNYMTTTDEHFSPLEIDYC